MRLEIHAFGAARNSLSAQPLQREISRGEQPLERGTAAASNPCSAQPLERGTASAWEPLERGTAGARNRLSDRRGKIQKYIRFIFCPWTRPFHAFTPTECGAAAAWNRLSVEPLQRGTAGASDRSSVEPLERGSLCPKQRPTREWPGTQSPRFPGPRWTLEGGI